MELFGDPGGTKNESGLSYGTFLEGTRIVKDEVMRRLGTKIEDFIGRWDFSWGRQKSNGYGVMGVFLGTKSDYKSDDGTVLGDWKDKRYM